MDKILIGYARVSTLDRQELGLEAQIRKLKRFGCKKIYSEKESGSKDQRKEFQKAIRYAKQVSLRKNKAVFLIVLKLDRLSRSTRTLLNVVEDLEESNIHLHSMSEQFDTSTTVGKMMYRMLATFAEFEVDSIRERTKLGMEQARLNGKIIGRPRILNKTKQKVIDFAQTTKLSSRRIALECGISKTSVLNIIQKENIMRR